MRWLVSLNRQRKAPGAEPGASRYAHDESLLTGLLAVRDQHVQRLVAQVDVPLRGLERRVSGCLLRNRAAVALDPACHGGVAQVIRPDAVRQLRAVRRVLERVEQGAG